MGQNSLVTKTRGRSDQPDRARVTRMKCQNAEISTSASESKNRSNVNNKAEFRSLKGEYWITLLVELTFWYASRRLLTEKTTQPEIARELTSGRANFEVWKFGGLFKDD